MMRASTIVSTLEDPDQSISRPHSGHLDSFRDFQAIV